LSFEDFISAVTVVLFDTILKELNKCILKESVDTVFSLRQ